MRTEITMLTVVAGMLAACSESDPVITGQEAEAESSQSEAGQVTGMTVLGEKITNAYTPEVMGEALAMLKAEAATNKSADIALGQTEVAATHLYLKFAPRDSVDDSWARGVEIHMARTFYPDGSAIKNYFGNYTSVVPDLLDAKIPMSIIEQALRGSEKWETWKVNVARLSPSKKKMVYEIFEQN
ncbi:MAG: hypothetical protein ACI35Q_02090 [Marinilabiliaceae bacterium]